jgi:hypothetical protein
MEKAIVAVAHEMARIVYFIPKRNEPYRGVNRGLTGKKLESIGMKALNGLRNQKGMLPGHGGFSSVLIGAREFLNKETRNKGANDCSERAK